MITFQEVPSKTVAAIRFSGWANDQKIEKYKRELTLSLEKEGIDYTDQFYFFGYNAPYELFNRRNEIIVELQQFIIYCKNNFKLYDGCCLKIARYNTK